jgi:hypothetical protein
MFGFKCISRMFSRVTGYFARHYAIVRREWVVEQYVRAGAVFGEALSYLYMGECVGFHSMKERWAKLERLYAELGYRTIPLEDFVEYGGYGKSIDHLVRVRRPDGEDAVFHAVTFAQNYAEGVLPPLDHPHLGDPSPRVCDADGDPKTKGRTKKGGCDCEARSKDAGKKGVKPDGRKPKDK